MGQKVHPTGIRLGVVKDHNSVWYADSKSYASQLITDLEVREYILKRLDAASVSRVVIERPAQTARVTIHTCLLYTSTSPRDTLLSRMPSSA